MNTDSLIRTLSADVRPVRRGVVGRRIVLGIVGGALGTIMLVIGLLGIRPDLHAAMRGFPFWMKWAYTISLGIGALFATTRLARPSPRSLRWLWLLAVPVLLLTGIGIAEMVDTPRSDWLKMWLGRSWMICPWLVLSLAAPIFCGLLWSFRKLAPTNLRAAGAAAGLSAGAWSATIYCIHCPEVSAIFVLTWYSLGIALAASVGALLGPKLLRW